MRFFKWILVIGGLMALIYFVWSVSGRNYDDYSYSPYPVDSVISEGADAGKGNIIGFQPYFTAWDYCDQQHFINALEPYFNKAKTAGLLKPNTIVVLPEYTGAWLVTSNEKATVYQSDSLRQGISIIVNSNIFSFILKLLYAKPEDKIQHALFSLKARSMARIYTAVFSSLAKKYKVTIVAGSIILPSPALNARGKLTIKQGKLYNASFVFGPAGKIIAQPVKKMILTGNEKNFLTAADSGENRIIQTPSGNLAVVLSADSRSAAVYQQLKGKSRIMAIPSISGLDSLQTSMETTFFDNNPDTSLRKADNENVWRQTGRMAASAGFHQAIHVFFSGKIWEMQPKGMLLSLQQDSFRVYQPVVQKGRIVNVWLN